MIHFMVTLPLCFRKSANRRRALRSYQHQQYCWHLVEKSWTSKFNTTRKHGIEFTYVFFYFPEGGLGQTEAWMPTYVSILRIPQMIWDWRATVEWYWQGKTEELGEKPVPVPLCPPQIPHGLTRPRTRSSAVRGRWLTTWAMARPIHLCHCNLFTSFIRGSFNNAVSCSQYSA
jgi:hypothetical protein